jgi:hypothetical protein
VGHHPDLLNRFVGWLDGRNPLPTVRRFELTSAQWRACRFADAAVTDDGRVAFLAC